MEQVLEAFKPLFDAAGKVKANIDRSERVHALGVKLWERQWEDAGQMAGRRGGATR